MIEARSRRERIDAVARRAFAGVLARGELRSVRGLMARRARRALFSEGEVANVSGAEH
jgi:hypothetical protein